MHIHEVMQAAGHPSVPVQPRLKRAAEEFEAQMMKELLRPLGQTESWTGGEEEEGSAGALGSFSLEALGNAISAGGGLGVAKEILAYFSHSGKASENRAE